MSSYNRVILMGNLTRDPQLRYLPSNTAVCDFGLAINRRYRDRDGNLKDEVCFVDVSAFGRQAETLNQYVRKGRPLLVEGRLKFDSWTGQDGQKRSKLSVVAENFQFVGAREGAGAPAGAASEHGPGPGPGGRASEPPPDDGPPLDDAPRSEDIPF